jgi:hypothetical protein
MMLSILVLLSAAVVAVAVVRRFRRPSMLAYLAVGMALGPHGLALLAENAEVQVFAEFGLVFLMFSIGLEFSLKHLQAMRTLVFGFGSAQMALTALGTGLVTVPPPVLCLVLALALVAEGDSRRWWDGDPTAKTWRGEESRRWRHGSIRPALPKSAYMGAYMEDQTDKGLTD